MLFKQRYLAGIAASMAVFGFFGLVMVGGIVAVYAGTSITAPIETLATGQTPIPLADVTTPFGVSLKTLGIAADTAVILPAFPLSVTVAGVTLSLAGLTLAQVFGGGGLVVGFLVGQYYVIDIMWTQHTEE